MRRKPPSACGGLQPRRPFAAAGPSLAESGSGATSSGPPPRQASLVLPGRRWGRPTRSRAWRSRRFSIGRRQKDTIRRSTTHATPSARLRRFERALTDVHTLKRRAGHSATASGSVALASVVSFCECGSETQRFELAVLDHAGKEVQGHPHFEAESGALSAVLHVRLHNKFGLLAVAVRRAALEG
eukprot:14187415-Alexandrium_andersonii.AAC.1